MSRQCAAPTLWRCQCMASESGPRTWTRYMPTLRMPRFGSTEMTIGSVMYGPPSSGQVVRIGSFITSISPPRQTTSWHGGVPFMRRGGNFETSSRRGRSPSLAIRPSGTLRSSSLVMRCPISSRSSTPRAIDMRRIEPKRLMATGQGERVPSWRMTCSKSSALPPPGCFMTRSAISQSSSLAATGCVMRASSPSVSRAAMNAERESNVTTGCGRWDVGGIGSSRIHTVSSSFQNQGSLTSHISHPISVVPHGWRQHQA